MTDGVSKIQLYELLKTMIATHDSVSMETDSFGHGQGASIHLYLDGQCVTRDYRTTPTELNDLTFLFFEYFQDTYEEGFESDHLITFHLDDNGDVFGDRVDYASTNYFGDELSIDPLVSGFRADCEDLVAELSDKQIDAYLRYDFVFNVSHSSKNDLAIGFKATKGRRKSSVALPIALHKIVRSIEAEVIRCAEASVEVLRRTYPNYEQSWTLSGDLAEFERTDYELTVYKSTDANDMRKIFEAQH